MIIETILELKELLNKTIKKHKSIALITHKNPDGDGLCACLAMQEYYANLDISMDIILEAETPDTYDFLDGKKRCKIYSDSMSYDVAILLDGHEYERAGICSSIFDTATDKITIDHHHQRALIENSKNYINPAYVSVGAIIFDLFFNEMCAFPHNSLLYFCNAIYTTVLNDTDNFINANTDEKAFDICRAMTAVGFKPGPIAEQFMMNKTAVEMQFVGSVLSTIRTYDNDEFLFMHATQKMLSHFGLDEDKTSKMNRWIKGLKNVKASCFLREVSPNNYRLSFRSNSYNVNRIAHIFGGGGHTKAAGCEITGTMQDIEQRILTLFREQNA